MKTPEEKRLRRNELARLWKAKNREKTNAWTRDWYLKNKKYVYLYNKKRAAERTEEQKEAVRARDRIRHAAKRAEDREAYNARLRKWSAENPDRIYSRNKKWAKNNRDTVLAARAKRRTKDKDSFTPSDIESIRKQQRNQCAYCRIGLTPETQHIDHIVALANGGTNNRTNIQLLCKTCNRRKSKRDPIAFAQSMGLLV